MLLLIFGVPDEKRKDGQCLENGWDGRGWVRHMTKERLKQPDLIFLSMSSWEEHNKTLNGMKMKRSTRKERSRCTSKVFFLHSYSTTYPQKVHLWADGFISTATHTHRERKKWTDVQARTSTKRENYVSFWAPSTSTHSKSVDRQTTTFMIKT